MDDIVQRCIGCEYHSTEMCDADMMASVCKAHGCWCSSIENCEKSREYAIRQTVERACEVFCDLCNENWEWDDPNFDCRRERTSCCYLQEFRNKLENKSNNE